MTTTSTTPAGSPRKCGTPADVHAIRRLKDDPTITPGDVGKLFGISEGHTRNIMAGKVWRSA